MNPGGAAFDYDKPIPLVIHALPVEVAQANLDAHDATCPGPYRLDLAPDHPHNEAWRRWAKVRQDLLTTLTIAKACKGASVKAPKKVGPVNPGHFQGYPVQHFVDRINDLLRQMALQPEGSPEWFRLRQLASSARHAAQARARSLRDRTTIIPEIPRKRRAIEAAARLKLLAEQQRLREAGAWLASAPPRKTEPTKPTGR